MSGLLGCLFFNVFSSVLLPYLVEHSHEQIPGEHFVYCFRSLLAFLYTVDLVSFSFPFLHLDFLELTVTQGPRLKKKWVVVFLQMYRVHSFVLLCLSKKRKKKCYSFSCLWCYLAGNVSCFIGRNWETFMRGISKSDILALTFQV